MTAPEGTPQHPWLTDLATASMRAMRDKYPAPEGAAPGQAATPADELLAAAADALWKCAKAALTVEHSLDKPYDDDPRWSPWTRWVERPAREAHDLAMKIRKHLRAQAAITAAAAAQPAPGDELVQLRVSLMDAHKEARTAWATVDRLKAYITALEGQQPAPAVGTYAWQADTFVRASAGQTVLVGFRRPVTPGEARDVREHFAEAAPGVNIVIIGDVESIDVEPAPAAAGGDRLRNGITRLLADINCRPVVGDPVARAVHEIAAELRQLLEGS